jgi:hypothetical protein
MLTIYKPELIEESNCVKLRTEYMIGGKKDYFWFSFAKKYKDYLVTENADAFLVGLLLLAMKNGEDIELKAPVSERLYYTISTYMISALNLLNPELKKIKIIASELNSSNLNVAGSVGTGLSCGVDSFTAIYDHLNVEEQYKINYFTLMNAGSHGDNGGEFSRELFHERFKLVKPYADERNIDIIAIDTNINEILMMKHVQTHTMRDMACILTLQKLFKYYYYASGYRFEYYKFVKDGCQGSYDLLTLNMLSTESISFFSAGSQYTRVERTEKISNYEPTYRYLNVCVVSSSTGIARNCSVCHKCLRTELTLDILGKLNFYNKVFNLKEYSRAKDKFIGHVLANKNKSVHFKEIVELMKAKKYKVTLKAYFYFIALSVKSTLMWLMRG